MPNDTPIFKMSTRLKRWKLGARRLDFIGQKFQQAQEMLDEYNWMYEHQGDKTKRDAVVDMSYTITGNNGQCQDLRDGYGLIRDLFREAWLRENRPYWLDNITAQYDMTMQLWIKRSLDFRADVDAFEKDRKAAPVCMRQVCLRNRQLSARPLLDPGGDRHSSELLLA